MTENFDSFINQILTKNDLLTEGAVLTHPPSNIVIAPNSDAEHFLNKSKNRGTPAFQAYERASKDWDNYKRRPVWNRLASTRYSTRIGVPGLNTSLALPGPAAPRAIGKIENDSFIIYWLGTHEQYNSVY